MSAVGIGIVGCGVISDTYLQNLRNYPDVEVVRIGDRNPDRARAKAASYGVAKWGTANDVIADADVQVVVNLTTPASHAEISLAAIAAGKHVWTEKPIGLTLSEADSLLECAHTAGVRIGCAPDTVLGAAFQTAKRAIAEGIIGRPLFAQTVFQTQGPDVWHPAPEFLFAAGAGPLFDIGPYYLTGLVSMFGAVDRVAAVGSTARETREIRTGAMAGTRFAVEVPTTTQLLTVFEAGAHSTSTLSFDSALERHGHFEIHGTDGSLVVPDPNRFEGRIAHVKPLVTFRDGERIEQPWIDVPREGPHSGRGLGIIDMVRAIVEGRPHVASGELGRHVLDVALCADLSAHDNEFVTVESTVAPIPAVSADFDPFERTL